MNNIKQNDFVRIENLVKNYGDFCAVDNLSFTVKENEIFGFLGPNGAGKSTAMNIITTLTDYNRGKVTIGGLDITADKSRVKRLIGMVPQEIALYPYLSAEENVKFFASLYGLRGAELKSAAAEALEFVGLSDKAKMKPSKMSGGMQRRLNIACGIAHKPKLIVMDEPTVGVDAQSREHILSSIKTLRDRGATVIYTSHYMNEVEKICDRIAIIDHGQFVACGTEEELITLVSEYKALKITTLFPAEFDRGAFMESITKLPGVKGGRLNENVINLDLALSCDDFSDVIRHVSEYGLPLNEITSDTMNLDSVFIALTGSEMR